jgi:hypothetical protein
VTDGAQTAAPNATTVLAALGLPAAALVQQRVPKKLLIDNGAITAGDKRVITEGIEEIHWLASLKPSTVGVPSFLDDGEPPVREYLEVAVLSVQLRACAKEHRIAELVHRSIPYPLLLMLEQPDAMGLSVGHIRWAQNEAAKVILDGTPYEARIDGSTPTTAVRSLMQALALTQLPRVDLFALVQGLIDALTGFRASLLTGRPTTPPTRERAAAQRLVLQRCIEIDSRITQLRGAAVKEKQLPRQVMLNLNIKRLAAERGQLIASLAD